MTKNIVRVNAGEYGDLTAGIVDPIMQHSRGYDVLFAVTGLDNAVVDISGATISGIMANIAGTVTAIEGALTVDDGPAGTFTWRLTAADTATAGQMQLYFTFVVGAVTYVSFPAALDITASA